MGCTCDPCKCGTEEIYWDDVPNHWRIPHYFAVGIPCAVVFYAMPIPGLFASVLVSVYHDTNPVILSYRPATKESVLDALRDANIDIDANGRYTGFGDPFAGDPEHMAKQQKGIDDLLGSLPSDADLCKCGDESPEEPPPAVLPPTVSSPIILDLNNDGVKTVDLENGVYFDHDGNRFAGKSGWVSSDDALLVRDINGNGQIDGGGELFGNNTELSNGGRAANGFAALAEFDSNGDGVVDKNDDRWAELKLWQDKNGNGKTDDGELLTLEEAGVSGLNIGYSNQNYTDENGNEHRQTGTFIRDDGSTGQMNDVWFDTDSIDTKYLDDVEVPDDIKKLPNLRGWSGGKATRRFRRCSGWLKAITPRIESA